jgi:hypothetical protein
MFQLLLKSESILVRNIPTVAHAEQELPTFPEHLSSSHVISVVRVAGSLVFCVLLCRSLFAHYFFSSLNLYCLSFDLRLLIAPSVSSNLSHKR